MKKTKLERPLVMLITHELGMGGAERIVLDLAERLPERGFEVKIITVLGRSPLFIPRSSFFGFGTMRQLWRMFKNERPAVVHTHLFLADTWGRIAARLAGVPAVISTEHNVNLEYTWLHRLISRLLAFMTDKVVAVSKEAQRVLIKRDGIKSSKTQVILNGIDLSRIINRGARPFHDIPRLITVGRFYPQKDHATLLKALALVKRPWRLHMVGSGPLEKDLRNLAERLHVSPRIEWLGERTDVPELLAESDIFCFPSRYEGLGLAAIEAGAAGVPVVASDIAPLHEVFDESEVTFVASGDVPGWAAAIQNILNDPTRAVMRATRARANIQAKFDIERMVDEYARLYRKLL